MSVQAPSVEVLGDFTPDTVPDVLLAKVIQDNILYVDVLNAGARVGTGLTSQEATDRGQSKNHWWFRGLIDADAESEDKDEKIWQVGFGMNIKRLPSIGSMENRYAASSRSGNVDSASSNDVFSDVDNVNKPPSVEGEGGAPPAFPVATGGKGDSGSGNGGSDALSAAFSETDVQDVPPSIHSSDGFFITQPMEGTPFPGIFDIKVRSRSAASYSTLVTLSFELTPGTTFGELLSSLTTRNIEPFRFRKLGVAYLGCRDFVSQTAAAWLQDGLMVSGDGLMVTDNGLETLEVTDDGHGRPVTHIYDLLWHRYTTPLVPVSPSDSDNQETHRVLVPIANDIDRAVWPVNFVHVENERLHYN